MNTELAPWERGTPDLGSVSIPDHIRAQSYSDASYCLQVFGDCLVPDICPGAFVLVDPEASVDPGAFVALWPRSDEAPAIKRLVSPMHWRPETFNFEGSNVVPLLTVEMLNPWRRLYVPIDKLRAVHRVVGFIAKAEAVLTRPKRTRSRRAGA